MTPLCEFSYPDIQSYVSCTHAIIQVYPSLEAVARRCSVKKVFLKFLQNPKEVYQKKESGTCEILNNSFFDRTSLFAASRLLFPNITNLLTWLFLFHIYTSLVFLSLRYHSK